MTRMIEIGSYINGSFHLDVPFGNRIVCRTIIDRIHTIIYYRLDIYKPVHKVAVPSKVVCYVHFVETYFNCDIPLNFPHLNMLKLNTFCFIIHTYVDSDVTFWNVYGLYVVWQSM